MNETHNSKSPERHARPIVRKAAFYGSAISLLFAIGAVFHGGIYGLMVIGLPLEYLCSPLGYDPLVYHKSVIVQCITYIVLPILTNAFILFIIGILIGLTYYKVGRKTKTNL